MIDAGYPVADFGPLMKGMVIGGMGILHVFLAQFAIGGGLVLLHFERAAQRGDASAARFVAGYFRTLVLVSFVLGALTGVAMWLTTIQVGARTIGLMVDEFHWVWAAEWCCFVLEVAAGYAFLRVGDRLSGRGRLTLLALYAVASWASLFWINGILSWQLTPGAWLASGDVWQGFFNPSFWPSLIFRTIVCLTLGALVAILVSGALGLTAEAHRALVRRAARLLIPMLAMPALGVWYLAVLPEDSRGWLLGGSVPMTMFLGVAGGASLLIGAYALAGVVWRRFAVSPASALLLLALAFGATAAGEFVREGARKPYTIRDVLYSSAMTPAEVAARRRDGAVPPPERDWPLRDAPRFPTAEVAHGARVARALCDACHTVRGANALVELTATWSPAQRRLNIAQLQRTKAFMPPFAGTAADVEALARWLEWEHAGAAWSPPAPATAADLARVQAWLDEAAP